MGAPLIRLPVAGASGDLQVWTLPVRTDNLAHLLVRGSRAVCIDAPDGEALLTLLRQHGLGLEWVVNTHAHADHIAGNLLLQRETGCRIAGPAGAPIPGCQCALRDGDLLETGLLDLEVLATPGHTQHDLSFLHRALGLAFVGDTVFVAGCGRLFDGTPEQMWTSIQRLRGLPGTTRLFVGHEYGRTNLEFACHHFPSIGSFARRLAVFQALVPTTVGEECRTNPMWMADVPVLREALACADLSDVEVFARIRALRDQW